MKPYYAVICTSLSFLIAVRSQTLQYANRFRNFTIESETGAIKLVNATIYQDKMNHKLAGSFNITRDIYVHSVTVILNRCTFEKSACENFQKWRFVENVNKVLHMKNQLWTPVFEHFTPKFNLPNVKKGFYITPEANLDPRAALTFYPDAGKYFWRGDMEVADEKERKIATFKFETEFFSYVDRSRKRDRGDSTKKP